MKPKNFPARKLQRQLRALDKWPHEVKPQLQEARLIRTKKCRSAK